ncbi:unnamed protein product [Cyclocybe aegerita]|uniref:Uncharacterized protein n=1 Tax=Cyclocybe aegerita TaxID=1973307 RepID=A0A8S0WII5_CYCAE|nr:unnamed protein product [Cyclocybe aegerita]
MPPVTPPDVPYWIQQRIKRYGEDPIRYEAKLYGPLDKLLNRVFPDDQFMVKPQSVIRPNATRKPEEGDDWGDQYSIDSYDKPVLPASERKRKEPDFVVVKASDDPEEISDVVVACLEVKKHNLELNKKKDEVLRNIWQLREYISILSGKQCHNAFRGVLVSGKNFYGFNLQETRLPSPGGLGLNTAEGLHNFLGAISNKVRKSPEDIRNIE